MKNRVCSNSPPFMDDFCLNCGGKKKTDKKRISMLLFQNKLPYNLTYKMISIDEINLSHKIPSQIDPIWTSDLLGR